MKGVIFSEMVRWVEEAYSPAIADKMITRASLPNDGSFTAVGNYPHEQVLAMMMALVDLTGKAASDLMEAYGVWLAYRFVQLYPHVFEQHTDTASVLRGVNEIHRKAVTTLYPDARTPNVLVEHNGQELEVSYVSHRPFADLAYGLIKGYIAFFGEDLTVVRDDETLGSNFAHFAIRES